MVIKTCEVYIAEKNCDLASDGQAISGQQHPLKILTIACLTFRLLLTYRPILDLQEYKLKVVNICKRDGTGGIKFLVLCIF